MSLRKQSVLGGTERESMKDQNMGGILLFGKVIKVYQKNHSADVQLYNNNYGSLISSEINEGKYACKILENVAGFDSQLNHYFGDISPIQPGCTVIVGFINNFKNQPVILGCIHNDQENKNILPSEYPLNEGQEIYRTAKISRLYDYFTINGDGEWELAHHSGAFITSSTTKDIDDENFEWNNLQLANSVSGHYEPSETQNPMSILSSLNTFIGRIRLFIKGTTGMIRLMRSVTNKKLTIMEIDDDGNFRVKLQRDSDKIDNSNSYTEVKIEMETGNIDINSKNNGESKADITIDPSGKISIRAKETMNISAEKTVNITSDSTINIAADDVYISSRD